MGIIIVYVSSNNVAGHRDKREAVNIFINYLRSTLLSTFLSYISVNICYFPLSALSGDNWLRCFNSNALFRCSNVSNELVGNILEIHVNRQIRPIVDYGFKGGNFLFVFSFPASVNLKKISSRSSPPSSARAFVFAQLLSSWTRHETTMLLRIESNRIESNQIELRVSCLYA